MLLLTSSQDAILLLLNPAVTADVQASYLDHRGTVVTPGRQVTPTGILTSVIIVNSPPSGVARSVKTLHIRNAHASASTVITVQHTDGVNTVDLRQVTLLAGEALAYVEGQGFRVFDADGVLK